MALDKNILKTNLENWLNGQYTTVSESAIEFANAYDSYALLAEDISGDNPDIVNKSGLQTKIEAMPNPGTEETAAQAFEEAITAYWTNATFKLTKAIPPSILPEISANVTTVPAPNSIKDPLATIFHNAKDNKWEKAEIAQHMADLFDNVTKTVIVTIVATNSAPPPTNITLSGAIV